VQKNLFSNDADVNARQVLLLMSWCGKAIDWPKQEFKRKPTFL